MSDTSYPTIRRLLTDVFTVNCLRVKGEVTKDAKEDIENMVNDILSGDLWFTFDQNLPNIVLRESRAWGYNDSPTKETE